MENRIAGLIIEPPRPADLESAYMVFERSISQAFELEGISQDAPAEIEYKKGLIRRAVEGGDRICSSSWPSWEVGL